MELDWNVLCRAMVQFLLVYHSTCSMEPHLSLHFQGQALPEVLNVSIFTVCALLYPS